MTRFRPEHVQRNHLLNQRLGDELFAAFKRVIEIYRMNELHDADARRKLSSLRAWMGPEYWAALQTIVENGTLTVGHRGDHAYIRRARDAVAMVIDWEEERVRWGLDKPRSTVGIRQQTTDSSGEPSLEGLRQV